MTEVRFGVSARHIHMSQEDLEQIFGAGYELTKFKDLFQPGEFASEEKVTIKTEAGEIKNVRILGPVRPKTQVEISLNDARGLKINPPIRMSGDVAGSAAITVIGPKGEINLTEGCIIAARHIHMTCAEAEKLGVENNEIVNVRVESQKPGSMDVYCRVSDAYAFELHIDTDDANAFMLDNDSKIYLDK